MHFKISIITIIYSNLFILIMSATGIVYEKCSSIIKHKILQFSIFPIIHFCILIFYLFKKNQFFNFSIFLGTRLFWDILKVGHTRITSVLSISDMLKFSNKIKRALLTKFLSLRIYSFELLMKISLRI